ncbi:unnamed protein product [Prorocentrum cordatum]|uniref:Uncharacterized protein n=1 Tax=Prorocentrum cordatum TaxID=2364126 RepID=A0ABN9ULP7_9DINO|nr:unnamed protein product [Polarella glacialis]
MTNEQTPFKAAQFDVEKPASSQVDSAAGNQPVKESSQGIERTRAGYAMCILWALAEARAVLIPARAVLNSPQHLQKPRAVLNSLLSLGAQVNDLSTASVLRSLVAKTKCPGEEPRRAPPQQHSARRSKAVTNPQQQRVKHHAPATRPVLHSLAHRAVRPGMLAKRQRDKSIVNILRGHPQNSDSSAGAAQPGSQQAGAAATSSSTLPGPMESSASAAQPGPPTKQRRLAAIAAGISSLQGDELHARLNEAETLPTAPFGRHDPNEQLFNAHARYFLTTLAALELPNAPFHVLLSAHRAATALQDVIPERRALYAQAASERRHSTPTAPEVCEVLHQFYNDPCAQHLKQDARGADVELAANRPPAYFTRLADSAAQPVSPSASSSGARPVGASGPMLPAASPPVMRWICGKGFTHNGAFFKRCSDAHGGCAERRKRLSWRAQQDGFKPLLPWVKRRILQSATFHLTFSAPGSLSLHWNRPEAIAAAKARREDTDDSRKCQLLTVQREAYKALAAERARVNAIFAEIPVDQAAANAPPRNGAPQQFLDCAVQMPEVERCSATRSGPGTARDPLDAARPEDDATDKLSESDDDKFAATALGEVETPIGMDPTAVPTFVQHVAALKRNLEHARELVASLSFSANRNPSGQSDSSAAQPASLATVRAAAEEQRFRAAVDLREAAWQLDTHSWERNLALLDNAAECDKALFAPSQKPLSMFDPTTWSKCFSEWWFGLPNDSQRPRKVTFEQLFAALLRREELECHLEEACRLVRGPRRWFQDMFGASVCGPMASAAPRRELSGGRSGRYDTVVTLLSSEGRANALPEERALKPSGRELWGRRADEAPPAPAGDLKAAEELAEKAAVQLQAPAAGCLRRLSPLALLGSAAAGWALLRGTDWRPDPVGGERQLGQLGWRTGGPRREAAPGGAAEPTRGDASVTLVSAGASVLPQPEGDEECSDALPGDECYDAVTWAMQEGIWGHAEWYPGLTLWSRFEEFQGELHRQGKCPRPCREPPRAARPHGIPGRALDLPGLWGTRQESWNFTYIAPWATWWITR